MTGPIPLRPLGKTGLKVSVLGLGGHHLGAAASFSEADQIVGEAIASPATAGPRT